MSLFQIKDHQFQIGPQDCQIILYFSVPLGNRSSLLKSSVSPTHVFRSLPSNDHVFPYPHSQLMTLLPISQKQYRSNKKRSLPHVHMSTYQQLGACFSPIKKYELSLRLENTIFIWVLNVISVANFKIQLWKIFSLLYD